MSEVTREEFEELKSRITALDGKVGALVTDGTIADTAGDEVPMVWFVRSTNRAPFLGHRNLGSLKEMVDSICADVHPFTGGRIFGDGSYMPQPDGTKLDTLDEVWKVVEEIKAGGEEVSKRFALLWPSFAALGVLTNRYAPRAKYNPFLDPQKIAYDWGKTPTNMMEEWLHFVNNPGGQPSGGDY